VRRSLEESRRDKPTPAATVSKSTRPQRRRFGTTGDGGRVGSPNSCVRRNFSKALQQPPQVNGGASISREVMS
jgi:hypothetical protein